MPRSIELKQSILITQLLVAVQLGLCLGQCDKAIRWHPSWLHLQVERLSKLIETPVREMVDSKRFEVINSTANVDKRLVKLFELIENDFLAKIMHSTQSIAPYKASVLPMCCAAASAMGHACPAVLAFETCCLQVWALKVCPRVQRVLGNSKYG